MKTKDDTDDLADINDADLVGEWRNHAKRFLRWSRKLAKSKKVSRDLKKKIDVVKAETRTKIRSDPSSYGIEKVTVDAVDDALTLDRHYRKVLADHSEAMYEEDMVEAAVNSLLQKKTALEQLVTLQVREFYAEPHLTPQVGDAAREMKKHKTRNKR